MPKYLASENTCITYTAFIEMFLDNLVDCAQSELFYELYMHAQMSIPNVATPRAILAGGCDSIWISATAQIAQSVIFDSGIVWYLPTVPPNQWHQLCSPSVFTMVCCGVPLGSRAVVDFINGANHLTRPLNLQYPFCRFT